MKTYEEVQQRIRDKRRTWLVTDSTAPNAWTAALRRLSRQHRVRFIAMRNDYPQSDPTLLLYGLARRKLRPGRLPVEQGVLMLDAAAAIGDRKRGAPGAPDEERLRQVRLCPTDAIGEARLAAAGK